MPQKGWKLYKSRIWQSQDANNFLDYPEGYLLVDANGSIQKCSPSIDQDPIWKQAETVIDASSQIICPGFIDSHLHAPQLSMIGAYGKGLLDWLNTYTFPMESKFSNSTIASENANNFFEQTLSHGVTLPICFAAPFHNHSIQLLQEAEKRHSRLIVGTALMDRHAPPEMLNNIESIVQQTCELVENWHNKGLGQIALTPRFAPSCTDDLLREIGSIYQKTPGLYLQTHLSETQQEVQWVKSLFPSCSTYSGVYEKFDLLGERTLLAHGIHLEDQDYKILKDTNSKIIHCPSSNMFLGSGLCQLQKLRERGIDILIGSDVGAGTNLSMWTTLSDAYKTSCLNSTPVKPSYLFYLATLGAAKSLNQHKIGNFNIGKDADFIILDPNYSSLYSLQDHNDIESLLLSLFCLGHEHMVRKVYIKGKLVHEK